ncbi:MAG: glycosyltransferase family 2 protein [Burkholderiaceae bacterium]|nr:glycosyltransferase family 2 protein [Burkholderiaceae bacterium]
MRVAIITAYHREPAHYLRRCLDSVRAQTHPDIEHIVVADGHPQDWLDGEPVRHLRLDRAHGDYGNTPRALGALLAASEGVEALAFLDADNWLHPEHVASCVAVARAERPDYVVSLRHLARDDGSVLPLGIAEDIAGTHVDTNALFLCRGAFHALARWALMPRPLAVVGDRIFAASLRAEGLRAARTGRKTVYYLCTWAEFFRQLGETPPPYAKEGIDLAPLARWLATLDAEQRRIASRLAGLDLSNLRIETTASR